MFSNNWQGKIVIFLAALESVSIITRKPLYCLKSSDTSLPPGFDEYLCYLAHVQILCTTRRLFTRVKEVKMWAFYFTLSTFHLHLNLTAVWHSSSTNLISNYMDWSVFLTGKCIQHGNIICC